MILSLRYGDLAGTVSETNKIANELSQYCDELSRKVQQKMYSVEGGMSNALNSADYYVNQKIRQLRTRESNARTLSTTVQNLLETAKRVDADVERTIQANQKSFFQKNPELKAPWYKQALTSFLCDMKKVPVIGWLIKGGEQLGSAMDTLLKDLRYWYKCEGGKEFVGIVLSIAEAVLAITLLLCFGTLPGAIGALIGLMNAEVNMITSAHALLLANGDHPGMAKIYAGQNTFSDVLRQTNFHDREKNRKSNAWATGLDITDTICSIINTVSGISKMFDKLKKINIKKTFEVICRSCDGSGQFIQGKPTLWNGIKSIGAKFNVKDLVLGDLNVKNLSRYSLLPSTDQISVIQDLAKAAKGIVADFDMMNEGQQSFKGFLAKRFVTGLDTMFFQHQELKTEVEESSGIAVRKYRDSNFTSIMKVARMPIDNIGLGKLFTNKESSGTLTYVLGMGGGLIGDITDISQQLQFWMPPKIVLEDDVTKKVAAVENWNSARGYFDGLKISYRQQPQVKMQCDLYTPSLLLPKFNFQFNFNTVRPYYNVAAN